MGCWNACNCIKKETLAQVFSCEFYEISKNTFFTEHLRTIASEWLLDSSNSPTLCYILQKDVLIIIQLERRGIGQFSNSWIFPLRYFTVFAQNSQIELQFWYLPISFSTQTAFLCPKSTMETPVNRIMCRICFKLTIKALEQRQWNFSQ